MLGKNTFMDDGSGGKTLVDPLLDIKFTGMNFNGVDIYAFTEARPLLLDSDRGRVTLKKGVNVIVFKILNEQNSWQGAMRLLDKGGTPLKNVKIRRSP